MRWTQFTPFQLNSATWSHFQLKFVANSQWSPESIYNLMPSIPSSSTSSWPGGSEKYGLKNRRNMLVKSREIQLTIKLIWCFTSSFTDSCIPSGIAQGLSYKAHNIERTTFGHKSQGLIQSYNEERGSVTKIMIIIRSSGKHHHLSSSATAPSIALCIIARCEDYQHI